MQQVAELGIALEVAAGTDGAAAAQPAAAVAAATYPSGFWEELSALLNRPPEILRARVRNMRTRGGL